MLAYLVNNARPSLSLKAETSNLFLVFAEIIALFTAKMASNSLKSLPEIWQAILPGKFRDMPTALSA